MPAAIAYGIEVIGTYVAAAGAIETGLFIVANAAYFASAPCLIGGVALRGGLTA